MVGQHDGGRPGDRWVVGVGPGSTVVATSPADAYVVDRSITGLAVAPRGCGSVTAVTVQPSGTALLTVLGLDRGQVRWTLDPGDDVVVAGPHRHTAC